MNHLLLLLTLRLFTTDDFPESRHLMTDVGDPTPCYAAYTGKLDQLLTLEDIRAEFPTLPAETAHKYLTTLPGYLQASEHTWPSDRSYTVAMGDQQLTVPKPNRIGVGGLSVYGEKVKDPKATFLNTYRTPTEEEKAYYQKLLQEKMEEEELSDSQQNAGKDLTTTLGDKVTFLAVEGIGDAAAWDIMDSALVILVARAKFKVIVNISEDPAVNIDLAKRLARRVFRKC